MGKLKKNQNKRLHKKQFKDYQKIRINLRNKLGLNIKKDNIIIIPIFIPHLGCKNECVFCNQRKISGHDSSVKLENIKKEIEKYLDLYKDSKLIKQIAFFGGSFTGLDVNIQKMILALANKYIKAGIVKSIRISTRPDYISKDILKMLKQYRVEVIEIGVQSMNEGVLLAAKRGHSSSDVIKASKLINKCGFKLGHQIILGLPDSNIEKEIYTIKECIKLKPKYLRIYPLYVLKESKLYDMYENNEYELISLEEMIDRTTKIFEIIVKNKINVIRIGLQTTSEINESNDQILGPVTNNYRERILSNIAKKHIIKILQKSKLLKKNIVLIAPKDQINYIVGYKRENINKYERITNSKVVCKTKKQI